MSTPIYAYCQPRLSEDAAEQADRLHEAARAYGGSLSGSLVREVTHPVNVLWQLIEDVKNGTGLDLPDHLHRAALARGVNLAAVRRAAAPATALLWLLDELSRTEPDYLLVPGPEHLEGFGVPGRVIAHLIAKTAPGTRLVWGTPGAGTDTGGIGLVAEIEVAAVAAAIDDITLRLGRALALRGLSDLTPLLLQLLTVLVEDCVRAVHTGQRAAATTLSIRVCCPPGSDHLRTDVVETPRHPGPLPEPILRICEQAGGRAQREDQPRSSTLTTLWLPLAQPPDPTPAQQESTAARRVCS